MEFAFNVERASSAACLPHGADISARGGVCVADARSLASARFAAGLRDVVDRMGEASAKAQGLRAVITTWDRIQASPDQRLYIAAAGNACNGILKVGTRRLFIRDNAGAILEMEPLCVLDFYVHESCQRQGVGRLLFDAMLQWESQRPEALGYDRPSPKLLSFLRKHFALSSFTPQANNYVVFHAGLQTLASGSRAGRHAPRAAPAAGPMASISQRPLTRVRRRGGPRQEAAPPAGYSAMHGDAIDTIARSSATARGPGPTSEPSRSSAAAACPAPPPPRTRFGGGGFAGDRPLPRFASSGSAAGERARERARVGHEVLVGDIGRRGPHPPPRGRHGLSTAQPSSPASGREAAGRRGREAPRTPGSAQSRRNERNASGAMAAILSPEQDAGRGSASRREAVPPPWVGVPASGAAAPFADSPLTRFVKASSTRESAAQAVRPIEWEEQERRGSPPYATAPRRAKQTSLW